MEGELYGYHRGRNQAGIYGASTSKCKVDVEIDLSNIPTLSSIHVVKDQRCWTAKWRGLEEKKREYKDAGSPSGEVLRKRNENLNLGCFSTTAESCGCTRIASNHQTRSKSRDCYESQLEDSRKDSRGQKGCTAKPQGTLLQSGHTVAHIILLAQFWGNHNGNVGEKASQRCDAAVADIIDMC
ncbi:hypothetical protein CANMA_001056 [Candida margitis]|uniref:uncharacterized protein n=1 Tax=Candida margitis TaxID=1775924 RepID=UPI002227F012|nr:uncharacterized protein CANMA_001056 [Candida margitis]KAI5969914.1 hypothetical protein CANMA_001056 [Candida margitis]